MNQVSTVYGPVRSWRVGMSLGIDLICETSVCSYNCIYCQLGAIERMSNDRRLFISTEQVLRDFSNSRWRESDIITYSGSGEPTLAVNLGEVVREIATITAIPQLVLTNGVLIGEPQVVADLQDVDRVYIKMDAASEEVFQRVNRPVPGVTLEKIFQNIHRFRREYPGYLGIQIMFLPSTLDEVDRLAERLLTIQPDEVQLNTPTRPYPKTWHISSRGGHTKELRKYESVPLRTITHEQALEIEDRLRRLTGLTVVSVYKPSAMLT